MLLQSNARRHDTKHSAQLWYFSMNCAHKILILFITTRTLWRKSKWKRTKIPSKKFVTRFIYAGIKKRDSRRKRKIQKLYSGSCMLVHRCMYNFQQFYIFIPITNAVKLKKRKNTEQIHTSHVFGYERAFDYEWEKWKFSKLGNQHGFCGKHLNFLGNTTELVLETLCVCVCMCRLKPFLLCENVQLFVNFL